MDPFTILLFFVYAYGLGYNFTRFLPNNSWEIFFIRIGVGLGTFPLIGIILNVFHIPLDYRIFLALALIMPLYDYISYRQKSPPPLHFPTLDKKAWILLVIGVASLIIYCYGPFVYSWLEDDDSWNHAAAIKFIAFEKNLNAPQGIFQYLNPYPPGYDLIFAVLHQTSPSLYWTLKFFNGLIVTLSIPFFYFFAKELSGNRDKAIWATFFLAIIPCYLTHFIWSHGLIIGLFFVAFYTLLKSERDERFILPAIMTVAGIFLIQPTKSIKFIILAFLLFCASSLMKRKIQVSYIRIVLFAAGLSLIWWLPIIQGYFDGVFLITSPKAVMNFAPSDSQQAGGVLSWFNPYGGSATRAYTPQDYLLGPAKLINNPVGIGIMICLLALIGILILVFRMIRSRSEEPERQVYRTYALTTLFWLIFTFLGMNSATFHLPVGLFAFRFWALFAIPVAFLAAETVDFISRTMKNRVLKFITLFILVAHVLTASGAEKLTINTSPWPWGIEFGSYLEVHGYLWLREKLPINTRVFTFTKNLLVIGNDMYADYWREEYHTAFKDAMQMEIPDLHNALRRQKYKYLVIGQKEVRKYGSKTVNTKLKAIYQSKLFGEVYDNPAVIIFKVL